MRYIPHGLLETTGQVGGTRRQDFILEKQSTACTKIVNRVTKCYTAPWNSGLL